MAAGLELRVPFLDVDLMRFVERIPGDTRVRRGAGKRLHRMAMERLLPAGIATRPKHGFATPYDDWLRASLGAEVERRYAAGTALAALIEPSAVTRLVDQHRRGRADHKAILYCLLELSEWHHAFVEAREPIAA
jgi:asparagine synthase (glutamine-hydrolysing)